MNGFGLCSGMIVRSMPVRYKRALLGPLIRVAKKVAKKTKMGGVWRDSKLVILGEVCFFGMAAT